MDGRGTVITWEKSAKGNSSDTKHKSGYKCQKVKAGEPSSLVNWWKMLTIPSAQSSMVQGEHLPYTGAPTVRSSTPQRGVCQQYCSTESKAKICLNNPKQHKGNYFTLGKKMLRLLWLFYFFLSQIFPNLAIKAVNFCFAWIQSIWGFNS